MNITEIITVSPINPHHGRHEIHAQTAEGVDVAFQISPEALGCLVGYFDTFPNSDAAYQRFIKKQNKTPARSGTKKGP